MTRVKIYPKIGVLIEVPDDMEDSEIENLLCDMNYEFKSTDKLKVISSDWYNSEVGKRRKKQ